MNKVDSSVKGPVDEQDVKKELPSFCKTCSDVNTCYDPERCDAWLDWVATEVMKSAEEAEQ